MLKYKNKQKIAWIKKTFGYSQEELKKKIYSDPNFHKLKNVEWSLDHTFPVHQFLTFSITRRSLINDLNNLKPMERSKNAEKGHKCNEKQFWQWVIPRLTIEDIKNMNKKGKIAMIEHKLNDLLREIDIAKVEVRIIEKPAGYDGGTSLILNSSCKIEVSSK